MDYLLKPFSAERLAAALARARSAAQPRPPAARRLAGDLRRGEPLSRLLVREGERVHVVPVAEIDYLEARGDGVVIRVGEQRLRKAITLGELEEGLDPRRFLRVHRSFILHLERLSGLELYAKDSRVAILADGTRIPVSRAGYARLRQLL
jgi:two-component system, LytTR family, response regulator